MKNDQDLWLSEVNRVILKKAKANNLKNKQLSYHSECVKFIKTNISSKREAIQESVSKATEQGLKLKGQFKKLIAFELLFHNLILILLLPKSQALAEETKQDIEELKVCFSKLGFTEDLTSTKRPKKEGKLSESQQEAL